MNGWLLSMNCCKYRLTIFNLHGNIDYAGEVQQN